MTHEEILKIAEENDIVAAKCCRWCKHCVELEYDPHPKCSLLGIPIYDTDVCKHFIQQ